MATAPPTTNNVPKPAAPGAKKPLVPPDERFWVRYSPHYEFPVSSASSLALHLIGLGVIVLGVLGIIKWEKDTQPLPLQPVVIAGGGGNPQGVGSGPGGEMPPPAGREAAETKEPTPATADLPKEQVDPLKQATNDPVVTPQEDNPALTRYIAKAEAANEALRKLDRNVKDKLLAGLNKPLPPPGYGKGGSGEGGGEGSGKGTGKGDLTGPGESGKINARQKRALRWRMIFDTISGEDYRRQLAALGAILAVPDPGSGQYIVFRDLTPPARGKVEDLKQINRIFWVDDTPQSVVSLAGALQIPRPPHIVAFFPQSLEEKLVDKELKYSRGKTEDQIEETKFRIVARGGSYEPEVIGQK